ncbi:MAG: TerC family protein [Proteobacteria bacterium]|nr:TerC family protein [Pseudomonadota bacterium]
MSESLIGIVTAVAIIAILAFDIGILQKKHKSPTVAESLAWTIFWILFALVFNIIVYFFVGHKEGIQFLSGYLIEKSLSVDNLFVFLIIFSYFKVPEQYQHKVLFLGILGAVIMRGVLIYAGISLIESYHWITYILGAFLILTGIKTIQKEDEEISLENNRVLKLIRKFLPVSTEYYGSKLFARIDRKLFVTPLFVVLAIIETTDLIFALDSIPAILAITNDPFILYSSNLFAILGLRALFFVVAGIMKSFQYLNYGISFVLIVVGLKMLVSIYYVIPELILLALIASILAISILASLYVNKKDSQI